MLPSESRKRSVPPSIETPTSVGVGAALQRNGFVEERLGARHDLGAPHRIEGLAACRACVVGDRIGAVKRIVKAAPARVSGVQRIAGV